MAWPPYGSKNRITDFFIDTVHPSTFIAPTYKLFLTFFFFLSFFKPAPPSLSDMRLVSFETEENQRGGGGERGTIVGDLLSDFFSGGRGGDRVGGEVDVRLTTSGRKRRRGGETPGRN